jgi:hypothetical protein
MPSLSGIIDSFVRLLTKESGKKIHIRPDNELIRVLVRKTKSGVEE